MEKCNRNDPCPCGSGKKFKKCCESNSMRSKVHLSLEGGNVRNVSHSFFKGLLSSKEPKIEDSSKEIEKF